MMAARAGGLLQDGRARVRAWLDSLLGRLTLAITGLVLLVVLGLTTLTIFRADRLARAELEESGTLLVTAVAATSADALYRSDFDQLGDTLQSLQSNGVLQRGRFFDRAGRVVSDTGDENARFKLDPDVAGAALVRSGDGALEWFPHQLVVRQPVNVGRRRVGGVELTLAAGSVDAHTASARTNGAAAGLVALATGAILARLIAGSVTRPLRVLTAATARIAEGSFDGRLGIERRDEVGALAFAFDQMSESLRATERARAEVQAELGYQAEHDALTDLPNRVYLMRRLTQLLAGPAADELAVLFLDLDQFKLVNDSLGHDAGDQLLIVVAERIRGALPPSDLVARLGGDEFVILLPQAGAVERALAVADRIHAVLEEPVLVKGHELTAAASIGIALAGAGLATAAEVLKAADVAMFRAKDEGRGRSRVYDAEIGRDATSVLQREQDLRRALEQNEFVVYYQPRIDLATGAVAGVEALVRWQHPERGLVPPGEFIADAERSGLIVQLGREVLLQASAQVAEWNRRHVTPGPLAVSVNFSARQFQNPFLDEEIREALASSGLAASQLEIELTESLLLDGSTNTLATLHALKGVGVRLSLDDFGTGYSSLSYLSRFPIDVLKIDRSFVGRMTESERDAELVKAIIGVARALDLSVTAEGIETAEQYEMLRLAGCHEGQGYYMARPMTAEALVEFLAASSAAARAA
jgi:diguanylate cyclase (GGDEF)-like protein